MMIGHITSTNNGSNLYPSRGNTMRGIKDPLKILLMLPAVDISACKKSDSLGDGTRESPQLESSSRKSEQSISAF